MVRFVFCIPSIRGLVVRGSILQESLRMYYKILRNVSEAAIQKREQKSPGRAISRSRSQPLSPGGGEKVP